jgi:hypothetical protein
MSTVSGGNVFLPQYRFGSPSTKEKYDLTLTTTLTLLYVFLKIITVLHHITYHIAFVPDRQM